MLYLLHGGFGSYLDWTTAGQAEQLTAGLPLIVVMPEGGKGGWYSNWDNGGAGGPPAWETFHIDQLVPWVDANFRTIAARRGRAIAGLSMGGFGALSYAARHPGLFAAAASFSGAVDSNDPGVRYLIDLSPVVDGGSPGAIYGSALLDNPLAESHNPYNLAANLGTMHVALYSGNGFAGPLDPPGTTGYDYQEFAVHEMTVALDRQLTRLGIPHTFDDYGNGTHSWPYWNRDLKRELPAIMSVLAGPGHSGTGSTRAGPVAGAPDAVAAPEPAASAMPDARAVPSPATPSAPEGTVLYVVRAGHDNGSCSAESPCRTVGHAVELASPGDTVSVGPGTFAGDLVLDRRVAIEGSQGGTTLTGPVGSAAATVTVTPGGDARLSGLTVTNPNPLADGVTDSGQLVVDDAALTGNGGVGLDVVAGTASVEQTTIAGNGTYGVANEGRVTMVDSTVSGNDYGVANGATADLDGATISGNDSGGVVTLLGTTMIGASTVFGNGGEGVQAFSGTTTVAESTITHNGSYGVASEPTPYAADPVMAVVSSTVSDNRPGGVEAVSPIPVAGSIVSGDRSADCSGQVTDAGYDLSGDATCPFSGPGSSISADADLGRLRDNGGPTPTEAPGPASRAVNVIPLPATADVNGQQVALCAGTTDQRGIARPQPRRRSRCDIGSVELTAGRSG